MLARSEPAPGSVMPIPKSRSPVTAGGRYFCFCAVGPEGHEIGQADRRVHRRHDAVGPHVGELLDDDRVVAEVDAGAAVLLRHAGRQEAGLPQALPGLAVGDAVLDSTCSILGSISLAANLRNWSRKSSCSSLKTSRFIMREGSSRARKVAAWFSGFTGIVRMPFGRARGRHARRRPRARPRRGRSPTRGCGRRRLAPRRGSRRRTWRTRPVGPRRRQTPLSCQYQRSRRLVAVCMLKARSVRISVRVARWKNATSDTPRLGPSTA